MPRAVREGRETRSEVNEPRARWRFTASRRGDANGVGATSCAFVGVDDECDDSSSEVLTTSSDGSVRTWRAPKRETNADDDDVSSGRRRVDARTTILGAHEGCAETCASAADVVASGGRDRRAMFWTIDRRTRTGEAALTGSDDKTMKLHALTRTSEGEDGDNAGISLRYQATFVGHTNWIRDVCVASDLAVACSASDDRTTRLWDLERVKCVRVFGEGGGEVYVARFHPQGNVLASAGGSQSIRFWDTRSGRMSLEIDAAHDASVRSLDFHPGGVYASSTSDDGSIKFWDLRTGSMCYTLRAHGEHGVLDGKFSPAGSRFVSSGEDGHCVVWRTNTVDHAENAPKMETRSFSHAQRSRSLPFCAEIDDAPLVSWPSPRLRALRVSEHPRPPQNRPEYLPRAPSRDIRAQVDYLRQVARVLHIRLVDVEDGLVGTPVARARGHGRPGL